MVPMTEEQGCSARQVCELLPRSAGNTGDYAFSVLYFVAAYIGVFFLSGRAAPLCYLDYSFDAVIEYAVDHGLQFGRDIVCTQGPLGFLDDGSSQGHLIAARLAFALIWSGIVAWTVAAMTRRLRLPYRYFFFSWFLLFAFHGPVEREALLVMLFGCMVLLGDISRRKAEVVVFAGVFALVSLIKFTLLVAAAAGIAVCVVAQLYRRNYRWGAVICGLFVSFAAFFWVISGQEMSNIMPWIRGSLEVSAGYNEAMALFPDSGVLVAGAIAALLCLAATGITLFRVRWNVGVSGICLVLCIYLSLVWKHGFVRADEYHVLYFVLSAPLLCGVLLLDSVSDAAPKGGRRAVGLLYMAILVLCSISLMPGAMQRIVPGLPERLQDNMVLIGKAATGRVRELYQALHRDAGEEDRAYLPVAGRAVGNEPVDVFGHLQWAALANGMNYRPRPVFQGFSAYTPYLQDLNEAFFLRKDRPPYVLLNMETLDNRLPSINDARLLLLLLYRYSPIAADGDFLVMKQLPGEAGEVVLTPVSEKTLRFGELSLLPRSDKPIFLSMDVQPTVLGRLVGMFFQPPEISIILWSSGNPRTYRIVPAMTRGGILLSPLIESNEDVAEYARGALRKQVDAILFSVTPYAESLIGDEISVRLYQGNRYPQSPKREE